MYVMAKRKPDAIDFSIFLDGSQLNSLYLDKTVRRAKKAPDKIERALRIQSLQNSAYRSTAFESLNHPELLSLASSSAIRKPESVS